MEHKRFLTVTLNPALDKTYTLAAPLKVCGLNRLPKPVVSAGGKGVNSARLLHILGDDVAALTFGSGPDSPDGGAGGAFGALLRREGLSCRLVPAAAGIRTNCKLNAPDGETELNESGGPVTPEEWETFLAAYAEELTSAHTVLLGGSIPQGVEKSVYNRMITMAKEAGASVCLDCDGAAFQQGVSASPTVVKPNRAELGQYFSTEISTFPQLLACAKRLAVENGVTVLATAGRDGAVYTDGTVSFRVQSPTVTVRGFAGAGDCFLASYVSALRRTGDPAAALVRASAAGAAKTATPGTEMPSPALIDDLAAGIAPPERV